MPVWTPRSPDLAFADELKEQVVNYVTENWNRASAVGPPPNASPPRADPEAVG